MNAVQSPERPVTRWMCVGSMASARLRAGRMGTTRRADINFPAPDGGLVSTPATGMAAPWSPQGRLAIFPGWRHRGSSPHGTPPCSRGHGSIAAWGPRPHLPPVRGLACRGRAGAAGRGAGGHAQDRGDHDHPHDVFPPRRYGVPAMPHTCLLPCTRRPGSGVRVPFSADVSPQWVPPRSPWARRPLGER
jgi:hypothetical protein